MMPDCNVNAGGNSAMRLMGHLARIQTYCNIRVP